MERGTERRCPWPPAHLTVSANANRKCFLFFREFIVLLCFVLGELLAYSRNLIGMLMSAHYFYNQKNSMYFINLDTPPIKKILLGSKDLWVREKVSLECLKLLLLRFLSEGGLAISCSSGVCTFKAP